MRENAKHAAPVDAWMEQVPKQLSPQHMVSVFERGLSAMWRRSRLTLGNVTLAAIIERVLLDASQRFPLLATLKVEDRIGVQFSDLRQRVAPGDGEQLREGMRSTFIRFLAIVGNLTADTLTPGLYAELNAVRLDDLTATRIARPVILPDATTKEGE